MGYNLLINGVYWGYNPLTNHLLTSWDILVGVITPTSGVITLLITGRVKVGCPLSDFVVGEFAVSGRFRKRHMRRLFLLLF